MGGVRATIGRLLLRSELRSRLKSLSKARARHERELRKITELETRLLVAAAGDERKSEIRSPKADRSAEGDRNPKSEIA